MQQFSQSLKGLNEISEPQLKFIAGGNIPKGEVSGSVIKTDGQPATGEIKVKIIW